MKKKRIFTLFAILGLVLASCMGKGEKKEPVTMETSASLVAISLEDLIVHSELIVIGEITETFPSYWQNQNKKDVQDATLEEIMEYRGGLFTDSLFTIAQVIKGAPDGSSVRVRTFIGETKIVSATSSSEPNYQVSHTYLLFLVKDNGPTQIVEPGDYIAAGAIQGVYEIVDGKTISPVWLEEWDVDELIAHIRQTMRAFFGPRVSDPLGGGELVSLEEAQTRLSFTVPLPEGFEIKEVWVSPEDVAPADRSVAIQFENDLLLIIHQLANEPNWSGAISSVPELTSISVNGHRGLGADPGTKFVAGKEYPYPGSVAWWINGLDTTLYSDTLSLEELLKIAETVQ